MDKLFLKATLKGQRFDDHTLPLQLARDFIAYEDLIVELAKHLYIKENCQRKRVPRGFTENFSLQLKSVTEGSTVISLERKCAENDFFDLFTTARDLINKLIQGAGSSQNILQDIPVHLLAYFNKFGQSIQDDEELELSAPNMASAVYNRKIRKILVSKSSKTELSDWTILRGAITEVDAKKNSFTVLPISGRLQSTEIPEGFWDVVSLGLNNYHVEQGKVAIKCLVIYDSSGMIKRIEEIKHIELLDPLDIQARIDELSLLQDRWNDGDGVAPSKDILKWMTDSFATFYPEEMTLPCIYPTLDGGLSLEWSKPNVEISLLIPPNRQDCLLSSLIVSQDEHKEQTINLDSEDGRKSFISIIRSLIMETDK